MRPFLGTILLASVAASAFAQAPPKVEFEVASIRPAPPIVAGNPQVNLGIHLDGAMLNGTALSLKDYIQTAYRLKTYQVIGPDWLAASRFDISAKLPEGAPRTDVPTMLRSLLAERFGMKTHMEKREFPVYALTVAKGGIKMKESPLEPEPEGAPPTTDVKVNAGRAGTRMDFGRGASFSFADNKIEVTKLTMQQFADTLARFVDRPMIDATDLKGTYDFTLNFTQEEYIAIQVRAAVSAGVTLPPEALRFLETSSGDALFTAIQTVGLKLEPRKAPLDVLVIDSIREKPTEN